jgi:hypothetical protein
LESLRAHRTTDQSRVEYNIGNLHNRNYVPYRSVIPIQLTPCRVHHMLTERQTKHKHQNPQAMGLEINQEYDFKDSSGKSYSPHKSPLYYTTCIDITNIPPGQCNSKGGCLHSNVSHSRLSKALPHVLSTVSTRDGNWGTS